MRLRALGFLSVLATLSVVFPIASEAAQSTTFGARPSVGLVLSGGGARGLAHIGVLKALEELSIPVDCITATSMGALVGGGYAVGYSASEIEQLTIAIDWKRMFSSRPERRELKWHAKQDDDAGLGRNLRLGLSKEGLKDAGGLIPNHELALFLNRNVGFADKLQDFANLPIPFRALSTDLLTGNRVVLSEGISISDAMLASMSIPAAFKPVSFRGMLLCDGCLVDNLPVAEAREMGADRLIVVNVGTPLAGADGLRSIPGIMTQVVNILTEQNVQRSLASMQEGDVLIVPELDNLSSADFAKVREIIDAGYRAVMSQKDKLESLRISKSSYDAWKASKKILLAQASERKIEKIVVQGNKEISSESIINAADIDTSKPVTIDEVEQGVRRLWGTEHFEKIDYRFQTGEYGDVLILEPKEWDWGQSILKFGGTFVTDFDNEPRFSIVAAYTLGGLNRWGGEWTTQAQFGTRRYFYTEFYQPLGAGSPWFLRPYAGCEHRFFDVYNEGSGDYILAELRRVNLEVGMDFGVEIARSARIATTIGSRRSTFRGRRGFMSDEHETVRDQFASVSFAYDTLDDVDFPRTGAKIAGRYGWMINDGHDRFYEVCGILPWAVSKDWTIVASGYAGRQMRNDYYSKGGVFSLSGAPYDRYLGEKMISGAVRISRQINDVLPAPFPVYAGVTAEAARLYDTDGEALTHKANRWIGAGGVYLGADTIFGSVFLSFGHTSENSSAISLSWGKVTWW